MARPPEGGTSRLEPTAAAPATVFVGRDRHLAELLGGLEDAAAGRGRLFLISGEPGIGKSRLADELSSRARDRGARTLWGRCWEAGGAPAYWPWVQSIRSYVRDVEEGELRAQMGSGASEIAMMIPDLRERLGDLPEPPATDPERARFRLFDAVSRFLRGAAEHQPLVLVLDDLHAADTPSVLLLRFLASQLGDARLLLLGAFRDGDLHPEHPLAAALSEVLRTPAARHLPLTGLQQDDVARFIEATTGVAAPAGVAASVHRQTDGNPLFVGEVVQLLATEDRLHDETGLERVTIPRGVRETIDRRLEHLSPECRRMLTVASVLGREFSLEALKRAGDAPTSELLNLLNEAAAARVVAEVPGAIGRLRFSHALVRDALYDGLLPPERFELHRVTGEALERLHERDPEPHLAELAHHFVQAAPAGEHERAVAYARRAADRAITRLAYEEAIRLYRMALDVLDLEPSSDPALTCDLLLALGDAQTKAGEAAGAKTTFLRAADVARQHGMAERLGAAALGYGGRFVWLRPGTDTRMIPLLEEALAALGNEDGELRVSLLARLAGALRDQHAREPRAALSAQAVEMARRIGDASTLAYALVSRYAANWGPENDEERLALATELVEIAQRARAPERELEGRLLLVKVLTSMGDLPGVHRELAACERLTARTQVPSERWYVDADRATLMLFEGRFAEAEEAIGRVLRLGEAQGMDAHVAYRLQLYLLRREQGRVAEVEDLIRAAVAEYPWYPMFRCVLAHLYAEVGRVDEARSLFDDLAADGFSSLPPDNEWLFGMCFLPEVAAVLEDAGRAAELHRLLLPYAGKNAYSPPELCIGPISRYIGVAAATAALREEATRHLEDALEQSRRMGARPWAAWTQHDLGRLLRSGEGPEERQRGTELLTDALRAARELGMATLEQRVTALTADGEAPAPAGRSRFAREGEYWSIEYDGRAIRLRDSKGLRYLHRLLAMPGREVHVADLASPGADPDARGAATEDLAPDAGHAGAVLDARARAQYKERIRELQDEADEGERWNDPERAVRAREEIDAISRELAGAYGLGGRVRAAGDTGERIRKAVTNRVRDALARIGADHPALGRHLSNAVRTGTFCSYSPDHPVDWDLSS